MPNIWRNKEYVEWFDCESITFKSAVNIFERMEIAEYIYEGVLEPSYKKPTREDANSAGHISKMRGEATSSNNYSKMIERSGKHIKRYVDW